MVKGGVIGRVVWLGWRRDTGGLCLGGDANGMGCDRDRDRDAIGIGM